MDLKNKIVLITGGATGLGFAYGEELLCNEIKHLAILDLATSAGEESAEKLNAEFGKGRVVFIPCDVTNEKQFEAGFEKTIEKFGGLDIVINNAGILNERRWELMIDINVTAVVRGTILGMRFMGKDRGGKGGVIVNIASIYGLDPVPFVPVYNGTKHAVVGLSQSFAMLCHHNKNDIRVLIMCPGVTDTQLVSDIGISLPDFIDTKACLAALEAEPSQKVETVAQGMVDIIRSAKSGTIWVSEGGEPIREVVIPDRFSLKSSIN